MPGPNRYLELWYAALHAPKGIAISTPDRDQLLSFLYSARRKADDPQLADLSIVKPHNADELWIVRRVRPAEEPTS